MAELADALDLGSSVYDVQVQILLSAEDERRCANAAHLFFSIVVELKNEICHGKYASVVRVDISDVKCYHNKILSR